MPTPFVFCKHKITKTQKTSNCKTLHEGVTIPQKNTYIAAVVIRSILFPSGTGHPPKKKTQPPFVFFNVFLRINLAFHPLSRNFALILHHSGGRKDFFRKGVIEIIFRSEILAKFD